MGVFRKIISKIVFLLISVICESNSTLYVAFTRETNLDGNRKGSEEWNVFYIPAFFPLARTVYWKSLSVKWYPGSNIIFYWALFASKNWKMHRFRIRLARIKWRTYFSVRMIKDYELYINVHAFYRYGVPNNFYIILEILRLCKMEFQIWD